MSNFFAALDVDSDEEVNVVKTTTHKKKQQSKKSAPKKSAPAPVPQNQNKSKPPQGGAGGGKSRAPKREFDRRSGTGRGKEGKKDGAGGHNWGKPGQTYEPIVEDKKEPVEEVEEEVEDEPEQLTLEEYEAQKAEMRQGKAFAERKLRKAKGPAEGTAYVKKAIDNDDDEVFIKMGDKKEKRRRNRDQEKRMLDTNFSVKDSSGYSDRDFGDRRGGRGGFRGGRGSGRGGRGSGRGGSGRGPRLDPMDTKAFPSLSSSK
uniref:Hyaluronan/mRNA-binding protein domain-containing protein n=1 Tax=Mucochytrium quahogii TaxID=96639 RepID=A0A7S2SMY1_9STRA|mmetsp:Transcript_11061/g.18106  ORF Transcript_11061/g.18106 Transcript_11061/m.18106 type:complete len:259 (+) Transcript_11061:150-926(+)|eukprot:CAMPEP_0203759760 /NCGR_PEP_ID=MMETSP0098-20131031/12926_1 /ASSEMBLY_ACC=CAM_ASM_000208 /TAXON_ID=96639 /ORGANISM=" , Strain NY0313808BC1" /LENGTH=258 /DNA_ID=CAMNT_0050652933 /DNA_START=143 /DNA_END=919 /DNA_ORIENTATION=-